MSTMIDGVLVWGGFRTFAEMSAMSTDDRRNTLIVELSKRTNQPVPHYQGMDDATLAGAGATLLFLRAIQARTDDQLRTISDDDQRNLMIIALNAQTGAPGPDLQARTNTDLVLLGLTQDGSAIRGVLLVGKFRTFEELNSMSRDDHRNTLIVELTNRTNQPVTHYQAMTDPDLAGVGATLVFLRMTSARTDAELATLSDDDQRNTLIVTVAGKTGLPVPELQARSNLELVLDAAGVGVGMISAFQDRLRGRIHQQYLESGGQAGPLGFPTSSVQFSGVTAARTYRGGDVLAVMNEDGPLGVTTQALKKRGVSVRFLGFKCLGESDEWSASDEPYFVISVDHGAGVPLTKKFGPYENTDQGTEWGVGEVLVDGIAPDPLAIRVMAYENDEGDPDETAKKIQAQMVTLAQQAQSLAAASGAAAADGPGIGPSATAGAVGLVSGPLGALVAVGIVSALGLGDDFIGQDVALAFTRPENVGIPPSLGSFRGNSFNARVNIDGGNQGHHELYFDIVVTKIDIITDNGGPDA